RILILPPHRYTLFPYTPLFRSTVAGRLPGDAGGDPLLLSGLLLCPARHGRVRHLRLSRTRLRWRRRCAGAAQRRRGAAAVASLLDRKSTRLNSSHVSSTYAVLC